MSNSKLNILTKGFFKENPTLILVLGCCPTLAVTTSVGNALGMGAATTFVLLMSNIIISALKNVIPDKVRIPSYIVIIATFVSMIDLLIQGFLPALSASLGVFIPLIVVNCIVLGRAEAFANKNSVLDSALDGLGMGIGFTIALVLIGGIREILGAGSFLGFQFIPSEYNMLIFVLAPGAFIVFGFVMAAVRYIVNKSEEKKKHK
ncbi:MAG: electron transport complex subunit E [Bacteroidales bacterium]|nr:electron transport complex subunit E [Bacteroidales bacterium]MBR3467076.1 electron transport complex subunit E [Bacteroidales bacterium]MBR5921720.1 electron transport complex subunit E [Bacteroidales bacterium]MBR6174752.1 electron transport complex subunit E [Bacteroidales bacterium]MCR4874030.1 electron transport complex subunit E [Bacteroidales bacterium]